MPRAGDDTEGGVVEEGALIDGIRALGRAEREAISSGDWDALEQILDEQKECWRELLVHARRDDDSEECREAIGALGALYEVRRRNHALIERSFGELRRKLTTAHAGQDARGAYRRTSGRAA